MSTLGHNPLQLACAATASAEERRSRRSFALLALAWALLYVGVLFTLRELPQLAAGWRFALALLPSGVAVAAVVSYLRFLAQADELQRRIHLEGTAWGFGVGCVLLTGYYLFERAGAPHLGLSGAAALMLIVWGIGTALARRRYQ